MAFEDLPARKNFGRDKLVNTVKAATTKNGGVNFRVSRDIVEKMGSPSFVRVLVGTGQHAGKIAVIPRHMKSDQSVIFRPGNPNSQAFMFTVGSTRLGIATANRSTITLSHEITDDGLVVDVRPLMKPVAVADAA